MDMSTMSGKHENKHFLDFWEMEIEITAAFLTLLQSCWAIQNLKFKAKMDPQTPIDPKSEFFLLSPLRGHQCRLQDHLGLMQGWESVS